MASHRRFASESSAPNRRPRPLSILSPPSSPVLGSTTGHVPIQFETVVKWIETKKQKLYHEGYLLKLDDLSSAGSKVQSRKWEEIYASLTGTVLCTWPVAKLTQAEDAGLGDQVTPTYINLMDVRIYQPPGSRDLIISTAGQNRYVLRTTEAHDPDGSEIEKWVLAVRLSAFERARMQEIYTANLFLKFQTKDVTELPRKDDLWSGYVDARIIGGEISNMQWKKMWCVISSESRRTIFGKLGSASDATHDRCQLRFYADKKDKVPTTTVYRVFAAYVCYPEHLSLIETAGVIKIEGDIASDVDTAKSRPDGFALIIPTPQESSKRLSLPMSNSSSKTSLVHTILKFLFATWSAFKLYNLPQQLLLNADHVDALGVSRGNVDLDLNQLIGRVASDLESEMAYRRQLRHETILNNHYMQTTGQPNVTKADAATMPFKRTGNERRVVSEGAIKLSTRPLITSLEEDMELEEREVSTNGVVGASPVVQKFGRSQRRGQDQMPKDNTAPPLVSRMLQRKPKREHIESTSADDRSNGTHLASAVPLVESAQYPTSDLWARGGIRDISRTTTSDTQLSGTSHAEHLIPALTRHPLTGDSDSERWADAGDETRGSVGYLSQRPTTSRASTTSNATRDVYDHRASSEQSLDLDPHILDLVQERPMGPSRTSSAKRETEYDDSIYSEGTTKDEDDDDSGSTSTVGADFSTSDSSLAKKLRRRADLVHALDIKRQSVVVPATAQNPFVRDRFRDSYLEHESGENGKI